MLVFEDLHWADDHLLDFVDHLVDWGTGVPLLVVCTARPELLERRPGWGGGKPNALTLSLSPLSDEETARLFASLLERAVLPAELQTSLLARAGGNPLYAEQFARLLAERGGGEELPLPENVQGIIAARLDGLPPVEKQLLQDAAVLGKVFWLGAVCAVGRRDRAEAEALLHALGRKEFVRQEGRSSVGGEDEYVFRHWEQPPGRRRAKRCLPPQPELPQRRKAVTGLPRASQSGMPASRSGRTSSPSAARTLAAIPARAPLSQTVTTGRPLSSSSR